MIDQSELTTLIIGGDWNCTLTKNDKKGGLPWRPTGFRNLILTTMDIFDLVDIQRVKHPNINKYLYVSKALKMRSRIDYFLVTKNLTKYVQEVDIQPSIVPDHKTVFLSLHWTKIIPRRPGFWKFNNALLEQMRQYKRMYWELLKMEIRCFTILFAKGKAKEIRKRELIIKDEMDRLDHIICSISDNMSLDEELKQYDNLKGEAAKFLIQMHVG